MTDTTVTKKVEMELLPVFPAISNMLTEIRKKLSKSERLLLINDLWDEIADNEDDFTLSEETEKLLDLRYAAFKANPDQGHHWQEVKKEIQAGL